MEVWAASEAVAGMIADAAAAKPPGAGHADETAGIAGRVRSVFGTDARSVDALERAGRADRSPADVAELASALAWYATRDTEFAGELAGWAAAGNAGGVAQNVRAGRDAYVSGRDQTIINYRRPASE
jgi:hypothetical protein